MACSALTSLPLVQTLTSTTRSKSSWRYSTSVMSASSVDIPELGAGTADLARSC